MASTLGAHGAARMAYEASGQIRLFQGDNLEPLFVRPFKISVIESNWHIVTHASPEAMAETDFHWTTFNLAEDLLVQSYWSPKIERTHAQLKPLVAPVACPDGVTQYIWLMLTPAAQPDNQGNIELPPVYSPSADLGTNPDLRQRCDIEYLDATRRLPRSIQFFNNGTRNQFQDGTNKTIALPAPYHKGFMEASFEATSTTNWNGMELPLAVAGKIFRTGRGRSAEDLVVATEVYLDVTDIRRVAPEKRLPPSVEPNTIISDRRVPWKPNQPITYTRHSGPWPSLEVSQAEFELQKKRSKENQK